jgi:hypothetical protein
MLAFVVLCLQGVDRQDVYEGECEQWSFNGQGVMRYASGNKYEGM